MITVASNYRSGEKGMFANGRKTIGVFISQVHSEFQSIVSKGIQKKALELDYNVVFYTNFGGYGQPTYDVGERYIVELPRYEKLDGIIITPDTMAVEGLEEQYQEYISKRSKCPVVSIRREKSDYYNVLIDDNTVIEEIIYHFIQVHGFTKLNFLAGPKGFPDSEKRLASFKRILEEFNIPIEEERIYYGDFWTNEGYNAVEKWFSGSMERPQAIICANDYMAVTVCNALSDRGISVPDDVAVSGCDDSEEASEFFLSITTAKMPVFEMGMEAVEKIHKHINDIEQPKSSYLKTISIYRESCGCVKDWHLERKEKRKDQFTKLDSLTRAVANNAYMSTSFTGLTKLEDLLDKLPYYVYENKGFKNFFLCLNNNWQRYRDDGDSTPNGFTDDMIMETWIRYHKPGQDKINYSREYLFPKQFEEDSPMIYFVAILHHQESCFGYIAISFDTIQTYMQTFQAWLVNVSNALENIKMHSELNRLVYKLEDMYIRDELTGLYNRRGFDVLVKNYLKRCIEKQAKMMIFIADMDKLKYINDNYGHASGDIAIKVVAEALSYAADDDEICMRCGGDEFTVVGLEYDDKKIQRFVKRFVEELDKFNQNNKYEFNVYVSYGWSLIIPDVNTTIEECLTTADSKMYQQKYEKEALRLRANLVR